MNVPPREGYLCVDGDEEYIIYSPLPIDILPFLTNRL